MNRSLSSTNFSEEPNYYGRYVDLTANSYAVDLHDVRMRHAYYGFYLSTNSDLTLSHAQLATNYAGM